MTEGVFLVSDAEQENQFKLLGLLSLGVLDDLLDTLEDGVLVVSLCVAHVLLQLRHVIQILVGDHRANLLNQIEVLCAVAFALLELGEVLNQPLHVLDRTELRVRLLLLQVALHVLLDLFCYLAIVVEHNFGEEVVIVLRDHHFWLLERGVLKLNSVVLD